MILLNYLFIDNKYIGYISDWSWEITSILITILIGFIGFGALSLNVIGFQYGDATKISWIEYTQIIIAYICKYFYLMIYQNFMKYLVLYLL